MRFFAFVLAFAAFALGMAYAYGSPCADGTLYGQCSSVNPGNLCTGIATAPSLGVLLTTCPCSKYSGWVQEGTGDDATCVQAKCSDGTLNGQCSSVTKPKMCVNSALTDNATKCGCPSGKKIAAGGIFCESIPCTDGGISVPEGTCSAKKEKKCVNGALVDKASECGCPTGETAQGETCGVVCSDGTKEGACSSAKPKQCVNGYLLNNATMCGCPSGYNIVGNQCTNAVTGSSSGADLLGSTAGNDTPSSGGSTSNALSCCCLPAALIGVIGGFAFFRKNE
ncbi:MAG: hypothetical protein WCY41_05770 [Candidatus Micrarchaeia archaeon]